MKNKFFYNKFLPVLSVFLLVLFTFVTSSYCANSLNDDFYYPENVGSFERVEDIYPLCFQALYEKNGKYYMFAWYLNNSSSNIKVYLNNGLPYTNSSYADNNHCNVLECMGSWYEDKCHWFFSNGNFPSGNPSGNPANFLSGATLISSSHDIYTDSSFSEIFFYKVPPVVVPALPEITQTLVVETEKVQIAEQLKTMIVGFLKYLIVLVISVIAFWKGWQFLLTLLRKA